MSKNPWDDEKEDNSWGSSRDVFGNAKKSFNNFFGKNPFKGGFSGILAALAVVYAISGFQQVQHDQRGVVLRFGKCVRTVGPGLCYVLPYPFEEIILQRVTRINKIDISNGRDESLMLTGDSNLANISFSVLWKIRNDGLEDFLFNTKRPEITVQAVSESVMRDIVGQTPFTFVQTEGRKDIQDRARTELQAIMDEYKMGIEIIRVELQKVEPPASVIDSFRDVERAQAEQQSEKNQAEAYARDKKARTGGIIAEKLNKGEAQKRAVIEKAKGDVAKFLSALSQYQLSPTTVSKRLYLETIQDIYKNNKKIIIDSDLKTISYLPLHELSKNKGEASR